MERGGCQYIPDVHFQGNTGEGEGGGGVNICACSPSSTVTSRAASALNGLTMYISASKGGNFSEIISAKGRSFVELELEASLFNGAAVRC